MTTLPISIAPEQVPTPETGITPPLETVTELGTAPTPEEKPQEKQAEEPITKEVVEKAVADPKVKGNKPKLHPMENPQDAVSANAVREEQEFITGIANDDAQKELAHGKP